MLSIVKSSVTCNFAQPIVAWNLVEHYCSLWCGQFSSLLTLFPLFLGAECWGKVSSIAVAYNLLPWCFLSPLANPATILSIVSRFPWLPFLLHRLPMLMVFGTLMHKLIQKEPAFTSWPLWVTAFKLFVFYSQWSVVHGKGPLEKAWLNSAATPSSQEGNAQGAPFFLSQALWLHSDSPRITYLLGNLLGSEKKWHRHIDTLNDTTWD